MKYFLHNCHAILQWTKIWFFMYKPSENSHIYITDMKQYILARDVRCG